MKSYFTKSPITLGDFVLQAVNYDIDLLALHQYQPQRYPYLLQSVARHPEIGRYDILFAFPLASKIYSKSILTHLSQQVTITKSIPEHDFDLPFWGGWFLFLAYEVVAEIEATLVLPQSAYPKAILTRIPVAIIRDHQQQTSCLVLESSHQPYLSVIEQDLILSQIQQTKFSHDNISFELIEEVPSKFLQGVKRIKDYIYEGDVFQVNLSRLWQAISANPIDAVQLYQRLCQSNPAPFAGLLYHNGYYILSSSPERLLQVKPPYIQTRPIAGTRPRAKDTTQDQAYSQELLLHPKEQAEHIMLVDLERNDLGRICQAGSINVNAMMQLESYAYVHHIVSNIQGKLKSGISLSQMISAVFPGGTITGCPKVRCMEIIAELEQQPRGAYTGALGFISHHGDMDFNILIRSIEVAQNKLWFRTGAGIVADSDPEKELAETRSKAKGVLLALPS